MKEKDKRILNLAIVGGLVIVLVIVLLAVYLAKPGKTDKEGNTETPNNPSDNQTATNTENIDKVLEDYDYYCEMLDDEGDTIKYYYENIDVEDDRVIKSQSSVLEEFNTEEDFNAAKANSEYKNGKFDDEAKNVHYTIGGVVDFTKSETGGESFTYYEDLKKSLEDLGYFCKPYNRETSEE